MLSHRLALPSQAVLAAAMEMLAGGAVLLAVAAGTGEFGRTLSCAQPARMPRAGRADRGATARGPGRSGSMGSWLSCSC